MEHSKGGVFALALALLFCLPGCHSASPGPAGLSGKEVIPARSETGAEPPLSESEMIAILQQLHMPEARVLGIRMSPVKGLLVSPNRQTVKSVACSKSLSVLENAYEHKEVADLQCPSAEVEDNGAFARDAGITAAPALIFPDGSLQMGYSDAAGLEKKIDQASAGTKG